MVALTLLVRYLLNMICTGITIALFFLQVRLLLTWFKIAWLVPFDNAGRSIVNWLTIWHLAPNGLSDKALVRIKLAVTIVVLILIHDCFRVLATLH